MEGIELLRHADEGDVTLVEDLHHFGEVEKATGESVHFVDDDTVDEPGFDVTEQLLECWPVSVAATVAAVIVLGCYAGPPFMRLALDEGFTRFPLGVEGVELLFQAFLGGFAGVDGTADLGFGLWDVPLGIPLRDRPKN